jgi:hypothetical protein
MAPRVPLCRPVEQFLLRILVHPVVRTPQTVLAQQRTVRTGLTSNQPSKASKQDLPIFEKLIATTCPHDKRDPM